MCYLNNNFEADFLYIEFKEKHCSDKTENISLSVNQVEFSETVKPYTKRM